MDSSTVLLMGGVFLIIIIMFLVINNNRENSSNLRKDGPTYLREVNPMADILPVNRDTTYPLPPNPVTGETRPQGQNVLSQNIADTNKIPESFTTWYDQSIADAMSAMSLYARGSSSRGSYGIDTNYSLTRARLVPAAGTTPIEVVATVANTTILDGATEMQHILPDGRSITVPIPANTSIGQRFIHNAPRVRRATAGPDSEHSAALKAGFTPQQITTALQNPGSPLAAQIAAANVGENWMAPPPPPPPPRTPPSDVINWMSNPALSQVTRPMPSGQPSPAMARP